MARWLVVAMAAASALWAGAGAGAARYNDYSAARMPQYEAVNYDAPAASSPAEDYRDRSADVPAIIEYNNYDQEPNDKKNPKNLDEDDSWQIPFNNVKSEPTTAVIDDGDSEYNYKSQEILPKMKYNIKRPIERNKGKVRGNERFTWRSETGHNAKVYPHMPLDDKNTKVPLERFEDLDSEMDKSKFVRRDIRQKIRRKSWDQATTERRFRDTDYDDQSDVREIKDAIKGVGSVYAEPELRPNAVNEDPDGARPNRPSKPPAYTTVREDPSPSRISGRHMAPMPKPRKKDDNEYVDYNDMSRIEKIKSLSPPRTARPGASRRWSFQDGFRRRNFNMSPQDTEADTAAASTTPAINASIPVTNSTLSSSSASGGITNATTIAPLPKSVIDEITAFVNKSKHLSIAQKSQLSILKKAQRKDSVKDELLRNKPPVLLQVTERLQTVVMVEPPVSQEPWLRARDIAEDSPERIEKVKRFMRNKLVANARNISELMENWDDTVCDYVDISMLDESNSAVTTYSRIPVSPYYYLSVYYLHFGCLLNLDLLNYHCGRMYCSLMY